MDRKAAKDAVGAARIKQPHPDIAVFPAPIPCKPGETAKITPRVIAIPVEELLYN